MQENKVDETNNWFFKQIISYRLGTLSLSRSRAFPCEGCQLVGDPRGVSCGVLSQRKWHFLMLASGGCRCRASFKLLLHYSSSHSRLAVLQRISLNVTKPWGIMPLPLIGDWLRTLLRSTFAWGSDLFYYGDWIRKHGVAIVSCNDGLRPVIMKLEATEIDANLEHTPINR